MIIITTIIKLFFSLLFLAPDVRRIWIRSCLSTDVLCRIWQLSDLDHDGYLSKPEFIIGMYWIDEQLKGNPLPS